jgi:predicted ATPase
MIDDVLVDSSGDGSSFVGRERELGELLSLARSARVVTLCGPAGAGKTWLLRRLLALLAPDYPDGTCFAEMGGLRQPDLAAARVASAAGVPEEPGVPVADTLAEALSHQRLVLALDGGEDLAGASAALCRQLLAASPGLLVIAARREALGLEGEAAWPVPPLALPPAWVPGPEQPAGYDAVRLFAERAGACSPGFALGVVDCAVVAGACRSLRGLPLAIELAAAATPFLTTEQIAGGLASALERDGQDVPPPDRVLRAVIGWAHDLLSGDEKVLLRRLSVFADWSLEMAERVCADDGLPAARVLGLLAGLADRSLIELEPAPMGQGRYRMPDAVRDYAAARLAQAGETLALRRRLRDYALSLGDYYLIVGLSQVPAGWTARRDLLDRYATGSDNIRAALGWCLEQGDIEAGLRLCATFGACWIAFGDLAEGALWFRAFLSADQTGIPALVRGPALASGGWLIVGDNPGLAERWAVEGLAVCRAAGNLLFMSVALNLLAQVAMLSGRPHDALRHCTEALAHARKRGDKWGEGAALSGTATAQAALGMLAKARESAETGLAVLLETDQYWSAARTKRVLAEICRGLGDYRAANGHFLGALELLRQADGEAEAVRCLVGLGLLALDQADLPGARAYLARGTDMSLRTGSRAGISRSLLASADLALRDGQPDRAVLLAAAVTAIRSGRPVSAPTSAAPPLSQPDVRPRPPHPLAPSGRVRRYLDAATASLGQAEVARLWDAGRRLTIAAAAELALKPPDAMP